MAVRFAGDFFGVPLVDTQERDRSQLLDYFPELRSTQKGKASDQEGARSFRNVKAVGPFTGFKTLETSNQETTAAPVFSGFKEIFK